MNQLILESLNFTFQLDRMDKYLEKFHVSDINQ